MAPAPGAAAGCGGSGCESATAGGSSVWRSVTSSAPGYRKRRVEPAPLRFRRLQSSRPFGGLAAVSCRLQEICPDEPVEVPIEHALRVPHLEVGAVVLHELVRVEEVAADRRAAEAHVHATALAG